MTSPINSRNCSATHDSCQGMPSGMPKLISDKRAFRRCLWSAFTAVLAICLLTSTALAQSPQPIAYAVTLTSAEQHLVEVQIALPAGAAERELQLPVWNALYQVRNFAQF